MKKTQKVNKLDRVKEKYKGQIMDVKKEEVELDEKCWKGYEKKRYEPCLERDIQIVLKKLRREKF